MLPVSENGEPDYDFMENYIHELEQEKLSEYKAYAQKQVSELSYQDIEPLENKEWKAFLLTEQAKWRTTPIFHLILYYISFEK